jgi:multidrug efflux pump subunit AcrB
MLKKIVNYFNENKLLVNLIMVIVFAMGIFSMLSLKRETFPNVDPGFIIISAVYPGAGPVDVEKNLVISIEDELKSISGIDRYTSISLENTAIVLVHLDENLKNQRTVKDKIIRQVNNIGELPSEIENLTVREINPNEFPVLSLGIHSKTKGLNNDQKELMNFVDDLEKQLLRLPGVSSVQKEGYREPEVHIYVDPEKLGDNYIALTELVNAIQKANVRSTGGTLQSSKKDQNIVTIEQFKDPSAVGEVIIRSGYGRQKVKVKDVAKVLQGFEDAETLTSVNGSNGVVLSIVKKETADVTKTVDGIRDFIKKANGNLSKKFDIKIFNDRSLSIKSLINVVTSNAIIGFILVFFVLILFLDFRSALWTAVGIPTIFMLVFSVMNVQNITLNLITLGALITIMGMLVDDGIVISENIYNYRQQGLPALEAASKGLAEVAAPVLIAVLTTIAAFSPMLFIGGMMGEMAKIFPIVIIIALLASLLEAFFLLPSHLLHGNSKSFMIKKKNWFDPIAKGYGKLLKKIIKWRYAVMAVFVLLFIFALFLFQDGLKKFVLNSDDSSDQIVFNLEAVEGTDKLQMGKKLAILEAYIPKVLGKDEMLAYKSVIGHHNDKHVNTEGYKDHYAQLNLYLVPAANRKRDAKEIIKALQKNIPSKIKKNFELFEIDKKVHGPDTGKAIDIKVISNDDEKALKLTREIKTFLKSIPGVLDVNDDRTSGDDEIKLEFDKEKMARLGLTINGVASNVRIAYAGSVATYVQQTEHRVDFRVELDPRFQADRKYLENLLIPNSSGRLIRLKTIASLKSQPGIPVITHYNGERSITIDGTIDSKKINPQAIQRKVMEKFKKYTSDFNNVRLKFGGEIRQSKKSMSGLLNALIFAVLAIYFLLVLQFKSATQPLLIIILMPFGLIGVFLAFFVHGEPLSFMGMIGIIGLCGVMVNDSVVMVDFINKIFQRVGADNKKMLIENIVAGSTKRLRPVILTTLTTVLGLLPTVYGIGGSAGMIRPVVMALAYGLLFATLITLVFLPCLYMISIDLKLVKPKKSTPSNT